MSIKVLKRAELERQAANKLAERLTDFQIGQARVKSQNAIKQLEFYGESVSDPDFQRFLGEKLRELMSKFTVLAD